MGSSLGRAARLMRRAAIAAAAMLFLPASAHAAAPVQCTGVPVGYYAPGEAQQWWETGWDGLYPRPDGHFWTDLPVDEAQAHGHIHVKVSMPLCQTVGTEVGRPTETFQVTVLQHEGAPSDTISDVKAKVYSGTAAHQTNIGVNDFPNQTCSTFDPMTGERECTSTFPLTVNYAAVPDDGWQSFRIRAYGHDTNGFDREAIQWVPVDVENGHAASDYCASASKCQRGTAWYGDQGYLNVSFVSPYPVNAITGAVSWNVRYWATTEACSNGTFCASEPTHLFASIDPSFHANPLNYGHVLLDQDCAGQTGCNTTGGLTKTLTVDPATLGLCNGAHKLFLRGDADTDMAPLQNRNVGVEVIPFTVAGQLC